MSHGRSTTYGRQEAVATFVKKEEYIENTHGKNARMVVAGGPVAPTVT